MLKKVAFGVVCSLVAVSIYGAVRPTVTEAMVAMPAAQPEIMPGARWACTKPVSWQIKSGFSPEQVADIQRAMSFAQAWSAINFEYQGEVAAPTAAIIVEKAVAPNAPAGNSMGGITANSNHEIISGHVWMNPSMDYLPAGVPWDSGQLGWIKPLQHEVLHVMNFDHNAEPDSIMNAQSMANFQASLSLKPNEADVLGLVRNGCRTPVQKNLLTNAFHAYVNAGL